MSRAAIWKDTRRWLPGVIISLVMLMALFSMVKWEDVKLAFTAIKPVNLGAALLMLVVSLLCRSMAWKTLLGEKAPYWSTFYTVNIGYLFNYILPLRAGEIARSIIMGQITGLGPFHVLSTIFIERAFDMVIAAGLLLSTLPFALGFDWAKPVAVITLVIVLAGLLAMFMLARHRQQVHDLILKIGKKWAFIQRHLVPRIDAILDGLGALTQPRQFLLSFMWICVCWFFYLAIFYVMLVSVVPQAQPWWAAFVDSVAALGVAIPSAPGGLGVFEGAVVGSLAVLNVDSSRALAYALAIHFLNYFMIGILGFYGLAKSGKSLTALLDDIQLRGKTPSN